MPGRDEAPWLMRAQDTLKRAVKSRLLPAGRRPMVIRRGPASGIRMLLDPQAHLQKVFGLYESQTFAWYRRHLTSTAVVFDIGAADGDTSLMFARMAPAGRVVAFEPDPAECELLRANLQLNPALAPRIQLVEAGVGASAPHSVDALIESGRVPRADFLKIDVDGPELEVLQGAAGLLAGSPVALLVEVHSVENERNCARLLRSFGYEVSIIDRPWWRRAFPEYRPLAHNRWLAAATPAT